MNTISQLEQVIEVLGWKLEMGTNEAGLFVATIDSGGEEHFTSQACESKSEAIQSALISAVINMELEEE